MSALINAIKAKDTDTALKLLTDDTIRATASDNGNGALISAASRGQLQVVQELLKIEDVRNNATADKNAALRLAAQEGHLQVVQELLKYEAVQNNAAAKENEALREAAKKGNFPIVQELLKSEVVQQTAAGENNYVVRRTAHEGHWLIVQELLKIGGVWNNIAAGDNEVFRCAARDGKLRVVQLLLKSEAVRKDAAAKENLALRFAAFKGHWQVVHELMQSEAVWKDAAIKENEALRIAAEYGHWQVVHELLLSETVWNNAAAKNNEALRSAASKDHWRVVQELLKIEAVGNNAAAKNNEILREAAMNGQSQVVQELLKLPTVVNNIAIENHAVLKAAAQDFRESRGNIEILNKPYKFLILSYLIEIYKKNNITLPQDIMTNYEGRPRNILSLNLDFENTSEEAETVFRVKDHWPNQLTKLLFEYAGLPFKGKSWYELKVQEAETLLQQFNDNIKQAEEHYKNSDELIKGPHFPSGLIYQSRVILIQNIIQKINELKTDFQKQLKLMREVPESNNAAWNSFEEQLKKQRMQLEIYQQQIVNQVTGISEVQIQTLVNKLQALSRVEKTPEQTEAVKAALQKIEKVLADKKVNDFKELHERLKATSAIFEPVKNLVTALLRGKEALWLPKTRVLEINQLYQEALRVFKQDALQNNHNEALRQELNLAKAALENIRRAEVRVEKEAQDNLNGAQQTLAEAYQEFHALTEIMQKVKHLARSFKPQVKDEPKVVDKPQVIHESPTLVWTDIKPTTPEMSALITDLRTMRDLLQKSKTEGDPKEEIEALMIKIKSQIEVFSITGSTLVEPKKTISEVLYEWFSGNEGLYNRLCKLFNDNSSGYKLKG